MELAEKKKSPDGDARYVFLSSAQSAISRTPTTGEATNESAAREVVVESRARPKKQKGIIIKEDANDEYR